MRPEVINQDGSPVLIEAVYYRYHTVEIEEFDSLEHATRFLDSGEEYGTLSSTGVFVDGEPRRWADTPDPPTPDQAESMREDYLKAKAAE